jgi:hypothetical protein
MTALATKRNPGRPRDLSFHERLDVALTWNERLNAQAKVGKSERHTALKLLMKKLIRLKTTGALPYKIFEVQAMMNSLGRYVSLEIRPPDIHYPTLDREVAVTFGIKPRMVRRCREELHEFLSYPWKEREHEALARVAFALKQQIRQLATQLMTPERLAKGEPLAIRFAAYGSMPMTLVIGGTPFRGRLHLALDVFTWRRCARGLSTAGSGKPLIGK